MRAILSLTAAAILLFAAVPSSPAGEPPAKPLREIDPNKVPELKSREGWVQCPTCRNWHPANFVCCCPKCGGCHDKNLKCRVERNAPRREAVCPVCGKRFAGPLPFRRNAEGGMDRDFCRHPLGRSTVESMVWMCTRCGYAHFCPEDLGEGKESEADFNRPVGEELAKAVKAEVQPEVTKRIAELVGKLAKLIDDLDQTDVPDWMKYEMAVKVAELRKAPAAERAKLALEGSYACRRGMLAAVDLPALGEVIMANEKAIERYGGQEKEPVTVIQAISGLLAASEKVAKPGERPPAQLMPGDLFYLRLRLAGAYDRLGEAALAATALDEAEKAAKRLDADAARELGKLAGDRRKLLEMEGGFRTQAIAAMRRALLEEGSYTGRAVPPTAYLLGELLRRAGQPGRAKTWMALASKLAASDPVLTLWIDEALSLPAVKAADPEADEERGALAFVEKLTGKKPVFEPPSEGEKRPPPPAEVAPKTCDECMGRIAKAYAACVAKTGKPPADLAALVSGGFIAEKAANAFKCPETGAAYLYRQPKAAGELILFHANPKTTACKKVLYSDGKVKELE